MLKKVFLNSLLLFSINIYSAVAIPGTLDTTFNPTGTQPGTTATTIDNVGAGPAQGANGLVLQTDGNIVVAGIGGSNGFALARFTSDGSLDASFNNANTSTQPGTVSFDIDSGLGKAFGVALQSDGKIVAVGVGGANNFTIARLNNDGSLDTTFNPSGIPAGTTAITITGSTSSEALAIALQPDGKIVVAGFAVIGGHNTFTVARLNTDGSLDTTFNATGTQPGVHTTTVDNTFSGKAFSVAIQTDGKIIIAGGPGGTNGFAFARFNTDGSLDTSFNANGVQAGTLSIKIDNISGGIAQSIALQTDGKIVAAGKGGTDGFALARLNTDGSLDTTFNPNGIQPGTLSTNINNQTHQQAFAVAIQNNGNIVAGGQSSSNGTSFEFAIARFTPNGSLDTTFNPYGIQPGTAITPAINGVSTNNEAMALVIQKNGALVLAGLSVVSGEGLFGLARFNGVNTTDPFALALINKYSSRL